jgi:AraC-like DNA-binding protein
MGCSPSEWLLREDKSRSRGFRVAEAEKLILMGKHNMSDVAKIAGFNSQAAFSMAFSSIHGMPPGEWVKSQRKVPIEITSVPPIRRKRRAQRG